MRIKTDLLLFVNSFQNEQHGRNSIYYNQKKDANLHNTGSGWVNFWQYQGRPTLSSFGVTNYDDTNNDKNVDHLSLEEPTDSNFGRQDYWDDFYRQQQSSGCGSENNAANQQKNSNDGIVGATSFSWYTGWDDLQPFVEELVPDKSSKMLVPGVGNDGALVGMYDSGFTHLTAFDYAPQGVACIEKLMDYRKKGVQLLVADARDLPFDDNTYDAALDKGTLDAIYLSGGKNKDRSQKHLQMANDELARVIRPGGVVVSVSAACIDAVQASFETRPSLWKVLRDGSTYITEDGYASNNVDGTILAYERMP